MKSTGIVRRVDDLGRVVIPRDIRRKQNISEGDPLEIFIEDDNIVLKKFETDISNEKDAVIKAVQDLLNNSSITKEDKDLLEVTSKLVGNYFEELSSFDKIKITDTFRSLIVAKGGEINGK